MQTINLVSDTVTKPTPGMLRAMMNAEVGDDVFGEDPTVNALQDNVAAMFGKEAALFCPSGTMTNQIALKVLTHPLDEVICDIDSHIYQSEVGGFAFHSGVSVQLIQGEYGKLAPHQIRPAMRSIVDWQPRSTLLVLENTCNKGGGSYYTLDEMKAIRKEANILGLKVHLDGARLFNALIETSDPPKQVGEQIDMISICLSKGLGAPVGSLLIGNHDDIKLARRFRKVFGGGMRQAGFLAAAGIYALDHHIERLKEDHHHALQLADTLRSLTYITEIKPVSTNIVICKLVDEIKDSDCIIKLKQNGILAAPFGDNTIRFVTHLDLNAEMINQACKTLKMLY